MFIRKKWYGGNVNFSATIQIYVQGRFFLVKIRFIQYMIYLVCSSISYSKKDIYVYLHIKVSLLLFSFFYNSSKFTRTFSIRFQISLLLQPIHPCLVIFYLSKHPGIFILINTCDQQSTFNKRSNQKDQVVKFMLTHTYTMYMHTHTNSNTQTHTYTHTHTHIHLPFQMFGVARLL